LRATGYIFIEAVFLTVALTVLEIFGDIQISIFGVISPLISAGVIFFVLILIGFIKAVRDIKRRGDE
jgi:hypothetical protein